MAKIGHCVNKCLSKQNVFTLQLSQCQIVSFLVRLFNEQASLAKFLIKWQ